MTGPGPIEDREAEEAVLGAVVLLPIGAVLRDVRATGLLVDHFFWPDLQDVYAAMLRLTDAGRGVDVITLRDEGLEDALVDGLAASVTNPVHAPDHARRVIRLARWRLVRQSGWELVESAGVGDFTRAREAMDKLRSLPWQVET